MLSRNLLNREAITTAKALLGKILRAWYDKVWWYAQIIETEAYFPNEKRCIYPPVQSICTMLGAVIL